MAVVCSVDVDFDDTLSMIYSFVPHLFLHLFHLVRKKRGNFIRWNDVSRQTKTQTKKNMQMNNAQNKLNDRLREINFKNRRKHTYTTLTEHVCLTMTLFIHTHTQFIQFNRIELSAPLIATLCCCCCCCFFFFCLLYK